MEKGTLMVLLHFSPKSKAIKHPFWDKVYETREKAEQEAIKSKKLKDYEDIYLYYSKHWRYHSETITDFYSYLKLNFPNAIPSFLFFPYPLISTPENKDYLGSKQANILIINDQAQDAFYDEQTQEDFDDVYNYRNVGVFIEAKIEKIMVGFADKWLTDILSGESFYEKNKDYFTKNEVKDFLSCDWIDPDKKFFEQTNYKDLLNHYWKVKSENGLNVSYDFFSNNIAEHLDKQVVLNFIKFICKKKSRGVDQDEIGDILDYIIRGERNDIDFENMTWRELRRQRDEWHRRYYDDYYIDHEYIDKMKKCEWKKTPIKDFSCTVDGETWTITEITTGELLYEEGNKMKNCVFSYIEDCISEKCSIFSVKDKYKRMATLEIRWLNSEYRLVQAKGKMNTHVAEDVKSVILDWTKKNRVKIDDGIFD